MNRIKQFSILFEGGECLTATLLTNKAPDTCEMFWDLLPFKSVIRHSRWSGREVNLPYHSNNFPKRENQTIYTSIGEVCYWRNWDIEEIEKQPQVIAFYYGAELTRSNTGSEPVNVFAQLNYNQLSLLKEIGQRIWLKGEEQVQLKKVE